MVVTRSKGLLMDTQLQVGEASNSESSVFINTEKRSMEVIHVLLCIATS